MSWLRHRQPLLLTALLDGLALALGLFSISEARHGVQLNSIQQIIGLIISYLIMSWLFGSYSLLRWPKLSWPLMLQRVGLSALATLILALLTGWLVKTTPPGAAITAEGQLGAIDAIHWHRINSNPSIFTSSPNQAHHKMERPGRRNRKRSN